MGENVGEKNKDKKVAEEGRDVEVELGRVKRGVVGSEQERNGARVEATQPSKTRASDTKKCGRPDKRTHMWGHSREHSQVGPEQVTQRGVGDREGDWERDEARCAYKETWCQSRGQMARWDQNEPEKGTRREMRPNKAKKRNEARAEDTQPGKTKASDTKRGGSPRKGTWRKVRQEKATQ